MDYDDLRLKLRTAWPTTQKDIIVRKIMKEADVALQDQANEIARLTAVAAETHAVEVKPLEWRNSYGVERADTPYGTWFIKGNVVEFKATDFSMAPPGCKKDAAQTAYNERMILSALTSRPSSEVASEAREKALRETSDRCWQDLGPICTRGQIQHIIEALLTTDNGEYNG